MLLRCASMIGACLLAVPAAATDWTLITQSEEAELYVDPATIKYRDGFLTAWHLTKLRQLAPDGAQSSRSLNAYDCANEKVGVLEIAWLADPDGAGSPLKSHEVQPAELTWRRAAPGTMMYDALEFVCARAPAPK